MGGEDYFVGITVIMADTEQGGETSGDMSVTGGDKKEKAYSIHGKIKRAC